MTDNEIKKAFDILDRFDLFGGQRAGRELWNEKPVDVQNEDIENFVKDVVFLKDLINRLQAENEKRKNKIRNHRAIITDLLLKNKELKRDCKHLNTMVMDRGLEINRLQTEIKLLTEKSITAIYPHSVSVSKGIILTKNWDDYEKLIADIANEGIKEFAEELKGKRKQAITCEVIKVTDINNLLKEKVGEDK